MTHPGDAVPDHTVQGTQRTTDVKKARAVNTRAFLMKIWQPLGESNPCFMAENHTS